MGNTTRTETAAAETVEALVYHQLVSPWEFENKFGIPEVALEDIQIGDWIGSGKKGTTYQATWKGQQVALKKWSSQYELAQWELERYCDLKELQGSLVPKLHFVVRTEDKMMFGLQLGQQATEGEPGLEEAMDELGCSLQARGWRQRESSWRADNVVWMRDDGGTKRLVAIDLESFIPWRGNLVQECAHYESKMTPLGIPYVSPGELELGPIDPFEGPMVAVDRCGYWGGTRITTIVYPVDNFRQAVADLMLYQSLKPRDRIHIPQPLFLTRFRVLEKAVIVGYRHDKHIVSFLGNVDGYSVQVQPDASQWQREGILFTIRQHFDEHFTYRYRGVSTQRERIQELKVLKAALAEGSGIVVA